MPLFDFIKQSNKKLLLFVILLYLARFLYCYAGYLKNYCWLDVHDESHIYLLGLNFYTSGHFPVFGPDIVYSDSRLTGGLQGLLVGAPLFIWSNPFTPYLFLFIIESISMIYLSGYVTRLFPKMPKWVVYSIIAFAPFTVHTGLKVINPAYVLALSVPFILSVMESLDVFEKKMINPSWRLLWMGFGISAVFQLHPSYVILVLLWGITVTYILFNNLQSAVVWFKTIFFSLAGFIVGFATVIPAIYQFGFGILTQQGKNLDFSLTHITDFGTVIFYLVTLCGYVMNTFSPSYIWSSLWEHLSKPAAIVFLVLQITGFLLFGFQIIILFLKGIREHITEHKRFLITSALIIIVLSILYMFSIARPGAHAIIIFFPLSVIYMCFCVNFFIEKGFLKTKYIAIFFSLVAVYYFAVIMVTNILPDLGFRDKAFKALQNKNSDLFELPRTGKF